MGKRILAVVSALIVVSMLFGVIAFARYSYTMSVTSVISKNGTTASCASKATGLSGVTKITGKQHLEKYEYRPGGYDWYPVQTWEDTINGTLLDMNNSKSSLSSGDYRNRTVFFVYNGSDYEEVEKISSTVTI